MWAGAGVIRDPSENSGSLAASDAAAPLRIVSPLTLSSDSAPAIFMARKVPALLRTQISWSILHLYDSTVRKIGR